MSSAAWGSKMASITRRRDQWRIQWYVQGRRRSKDFKSRAEVMHFEAQLRLGVADTTPALRSSPTFAQFAEVYLRDYVRVVKAESTWAHDEAVIRNHLTPYLGVLRLRELSKSHLVAVRAELIRKPLMKKRKGPRDTSKPEKTLSPRSVNLAVALAKHMLTVAVDMGFLETNPFQRVKQLPLGDQPFGFWLPEERDRFVDATMATDPDFTRLVIVACHTGLRAGELAALTRADLDFARGMVRVSKSWDQALQKVKPTKNREAADVPMNAAVREALAPVRFVQPSQPVFDRALFWSPRKRLARLAKKAGVPPIRFHDLRHTFASQLAMAGVDLLKIQALCRHKSYAMTLRYAHLHPDHLKGATDILCSTQTAPKRGAGSKSGRPTRT